MKIGRTDGKKEDVDGNFNGFPRDNLLFLLSRDCTFVRTRLTRDTSVSKAVEREATLSCGTSARGQTYWTTIG